MSGRWAHLVGGGDIRNRQRLGDDGGEELGERGGDGERVEIIPGDARDGEEIGGEG